MLNIYVTVLCITQCFGHLHQWLYKELISLVQDNNNEFLEFQSEPGWFYIFSDTFSHLSDYGQTWVHCSGTQMYLNHPWTGFFLFQMNRNIIINIY